MGHWNYDLLALLIVWQGPIATLLGGAAATACLLKPGLVFITGITGNLTADILWHSVGRTGNLDRLFERGRLQSQLPRLEVIKQAMERHSTKILLLAKLSFGLAIPTLVAAGVSNVRWRMWFPIVFIGESIWTGTLVIVGYYATEAIKQAAESLQLLLFAITFSVLAVLLWYIPPTIRENNHLDLKPIEENKNALGELPSAFRQLYEIFIAAVSV